MSYQALYRKWRPLIFDDIVEQEHVVKILRNSIKSARIAHAYLFCGTRGTGKTTMAQIFSRAVNCLHPVEGDPCNKCEICTGILSGTILDVIEIDAASNNSVENVRDIREEVVYTPSQAKYKVYIIDEVHMLSTGAFNALLKTLEEPPPHVIFILATTEPHKLPATILSRCQRFDFRRITTESIIKRLEIIAIDSGAGISAEAAKLIARISDGALRDAISILDQCLSVANGKISYDNVISVVGIVNDSFLGDVADVLIERKTASIFELVERLVMDGKDISQFLADLILYYRNLLVCKLTGKPGSIVEAGEESLNRMKKQCTSYELYELSGIIRELSSFESSLKWAVHPRILLEVALIKICEGELAEQSILNKAAATTSKSGIAVAGNVGADGSTANKTEHLIEQVTPENGTIAVPFTGGKPANSDIKIDELKESKESKESRELRESKELKGSQESRELKGSKGSMESNELKELDIWNSVLREIKSSGKPTLYMHLLDTRAYIDSRKTVFIVFGPGGSMNKMMAQRIENIELVNSILNSMLGSQAVLRFVNENEMSDKVFSIKNIKDSKNSNNSYDSNNNSSNNSNDSNNSSNNSNDSTSSHGNHNETDKNQLVEKIRSFVSDTDIPFNIIDE